MSRSVCLPAEYVKIVFWRPTDAAGFLAVLPMASPTLTAGSVNELVWKIVRARDNGESGAAQLENKATVQTNY